MEQKSRKQLRLKGYDYTTNGAYFITICTKDMQRILSTIVGGDDLGAPLVDLTAYGQIVEKNILMINEMYPELNVDRYVVMPNHIHLMLSVNHTERIATGAPRSSPPTATIPKCITAFKKFSSRQIGKNIWQRNYYDHIIRNEEDYLLHLQYIDENPRKWAMGKDEYYA